MRDLKRLAVVNSVQMVSMILIASLLPRNWLVAFWAGLIVCYALANKISPPQSFIVALGVILGFGFFLAGCAWIGRLSAANQATGIARHVAVSGCLICTWLQVAVIKECSRNYAALEIENRELRKYETDILTESELLYRFKVMHTSMKRKGETGWVVFYAVRGPEYAVPALMSAVSRACARGVRGFFDLVGRVSDTVLVVVLQAVDKVRCQLIIDRINKLLTEQLVLGSDRLIISAHSVPDVWSEAERLMLEKGRVLGQN